ncbi:MAG: type II secretion system protein N [Moraxellaceae bacterium]
MIDAVRHEDKAVSLTPYLLLGVLALLLALIARAPASLLQKALPASLPVQASAWGGTVWQGQAALQLGGRPGFLEWQLQPLKVFSGRLLADVQSRGEMTLSAQAELGMGSWALREGRGEIPSTVLQALLPPGWSLPGSVRAENLLLARKGHGSGPWTAAGGRLFWGGGAMQYRIESQEQAATLPALVLDLRLEGETLVLALNEEAGSLGLALLRLEPDGTVEARLRERLLRYTPGYRSSGGDADAIVVTARQKL